METALVLFSLVIGAIAGYRMLGRAARVVWARFVSNVFVQEAWAWVVAWGAAPEDYVTNGEQHTSSLAVSPQTDNRSDQTDAAPVLDIPKPTRDELLTMYQVLRAHNMSRETARKMLNGVHLPLDNNLWADAAPKPAAPDEPQALTPYAGRPYNPKQYQDDPELAYTAPPK